MGKQDYSDFTAINKSREKILLFDWFDIMLFVIPEWKKEGICSIKITETI